MQDTSILSTVERRSKIIDMLQERGRVQVQELSELFDVSFVTVRNDFAYLEEKGFLLRTRGGAIRQTKVALDLALSEKSRKMADEKRRIGKKAAELIQENDTIILDSGTTTLEIARNIHVDQLTVITNALNIASELASREHVEIIMLGGTLRSKSYSLVGSLAEENLRNFFCDRLFLGVDGFDTIYGPSTPSVPEAQVNRMMAEISSEVIIVADSTKFGKRSLAHILPMTQIDIVITDTGISEEAKQEIENQNIELIIV